jgi:hypothetical protein
MGKVYLAEQEHPVHRQVALKVIKLGLETQEVLARFDSERQALAMMDHPNIAKVFDAGATELGRSYFVMEHVPGIPITEYCDQNRLTNRERLSASGRKNLPRSPLLKSYSGFMPLLRMHGLLVGGGAENRRIRARSSVNCSNVWTTNKYRPFVSFPSVTHRTSLSLCSSSGISKDL